MLLWIHCFRLFFIRTFVCLSISWSTAWNLGSFKVYSLFSYQCTSSILRIDFRSCSATSERIFQSHSSLSSLGDSLFTISYRQPFVNNFLFFFCFFRSGCSRFVSDSQSAWLVYLVSTVLSTTFFDFFWIVSTTQKICLSSERRRRDLNPRAAINDLHPFQGCPFGQLGYFSE